jgi:hypothetical protein
MANTQPARAGVIPEMQVVVAQQASFDELYAAHFGNLTVQQLPLLR